MKKVLSQLTCWYQFWNVMGWSVMSVGVLGQQTMAGDSENRRGGEAGGGGGLRGFLIS